MTEGAPQRERRGGHRRKDDISGEDTIGVLKKTIEIFSDATMDLRRLAWTAVLILCAVSVAAVIALTAALLHSEDVNQHATTALAKSNRAEAKSQKNARLLQRQQRLLQAQASGSCFRVNYLRWQDDKERYANWQRDRHAALFLNQIPHPSTENLAVFFAQAAQQTYFLPLTDCRAALANPTHYKPPNAMPFNKVSMRVLNKTLNNPPQPPAN